ncbi:partitioning defective 3 homolog B isoform X3 [Alligator mississippiensis]|uniref:partitioning defective 3 homolog B isoform X3 n=1 Tax=Alligator mississippiensis TaxID=8496 RepID=UPI0028780DA1|nr:partitioning defective 3 homolog B isoform X3 [Alligator mississippiensis]
MKVTVCFGKTGIVVPCKDGQLRVCDLTQQALQRYLKTKEKDPAYWVNIHHLEYTDGGILDPDDVLADVVEDKDKEPTNCTWLSPRPWPLHWPAHTISRQGCCCHCCSRQKTCLASLASKSSSLCPCCSTCSQQQLIAVYDEQESHHKIDGTNGSLTDGHSPDPFEMEVAAQLAAFQPIGGEIEVTPSALKLGTPLLVRRSSDSAFGPLTDFHPSASHHSDHSLKPVVPGAPQISFEDEELNLIGHTELLTSQKTKFTFSDMTRRVEISGEGGPLGIHVVPFFSSLSGRMLGLFIRGIEENSRSRRDGLFHENECIVKINHVDLVDRTFAQAQDIFRQAMKSQSVILEVVPPYNREAYEKSVIAPFCLLDTEEGVPKTKVPPPVHPKPAIKTVDLSGMNSLDTCVQATTLQQTKSPNLPRLGRKPSSPSLSPLLGFGNKKHAKRIKIDLKKGPEGLGFTVVTRDSSVHGPGPIFVKNILPKGAAVKDGRLQSGDRLLEVNGRDITGRTQEELVAMLRSTKQGETVSLIVARQEEAFLPRELKGEPNCSVLSPETTEQLTFEIPLNDSGSAGLGVSLKGNKSRETGADLGIFIKSVIHGGAAFKDGRLRINDQLIAVNGESLLGKSNHEAMETLRRSMSMEGNIRGMIQLVVLRRLERQMEERSDHGVFQKPAFEGSHNFTAISRRNDTVQQQFVTCSPQERLKVSDLPMSDHGNAENEVPPPLPPHPTEELLTEDYNHSSVVDSAAYLTDQHINFRSLTPAKQPESINLKTSKSMDLVADESKVSSLGGQKLESPGKDFGPTLGLKKSSSLESLQTAVAEVKKNELPFHRPRPHMVRGRGCNESFRAAIDKSYDGPEDVEEDGLSDKSSHSGQEAQNFESAPQGNNDLEDVEGKAKKDKKNKEKEKKKEKSKGKVKEKKRKEENEDPEKKTKKKGFSAMLRIGAKHQELQQKQARGLADYSTSPGGPDIDDDEMDPNYARVNHFREVYPVANVYRPSSPLATETFGYPCDGPQVPVEREYLEGLYAKINKHHHPQATGDSGCPVSGNADRIQKLRKEYHQARREGLPFYEDDDGRTRSSDYDQHWVSGKGPDGSSHNPHFEGMERQYASLPRSGPAESMEYLTGPRVIYKERDLPYYQGGQPTVLLSKGNYSRAQDMRVAELRYPQYYQPQPLTTQHKGPLRQDVPPSPPQSHRAPAYNEMGRARHRGTSPDQYQYRPQDPRQKNPMTAAV